jgi:hypothetical protein
MKLSGFTRTVLHAKLALKSLVKVLCLKTLNAFANYIGRLGCY